MKANHHSFIFIILAILLSFFTPLSELCLNVFSDKMYTESSMQDSCIGLQYASIIENNNEFENHTPEYDLSTCFCLTSRKLHEEIVDLVLFDFNTHDIDVFRFLDVMKKDETYKFIPIVIIITERSNIDAEDLLEKHSIDYIKQPINPIEIKQKLNHIMKREYEDLRLAFS
jgi:CheY-like chemotaxis protein